MAKIQLVAHAVVTGYSRTLSRSHLISKIFLQVYTNIRKFKEDLSAYPAHHFVCVPLVLETLYGRVRALPTSRV